MQEAHRVLVRVSGQRVGRLLGGRLLLVWLEGRGSRVGLALNGVTGLLSGRLLGVGLERKTSKMTALGI